MAVMTDRCGRQLVPLLNHGICGPITNGSIEEIDCGKSSRRKCGCLKTSEKLNQIIGSFPVPPPPTPIDVMTYDKACGYAYGHCGESKLPSMPCSQQASSGCGKDSERKLEHGCGKTWRIVADLVTVVQLSVTATALALYYLIYCYMQIVYYTLKSAIYLHNADGPMKVTIAVVTATTLIIAFNIMMRMEAILSIVY